jgi:hypothetical protein
LSYMSWSFKTCHIWAVWQRIYIYGLQTALIYFLFNIFLFLRNMWRTLLFAFILMISRAMTIIIKNLLAFLIWWSLEAYMIVNFRDRGISRAAHKLAQTLTLIIIIIIINHLAFMRLHWVWRVINTIIIHN